MTGIVTRPTKDNIGKVKFLNSQLDLVCATCTLAHTATIVARTNSQFLCNSKTNSSQLQHCQRNKPNQQHQKQQTPTKRNNQPNNPSTHTHPNPSPAPPPPHTLPPKKLKLTHIIILLISIGSNVVSMLLKQKSLRSVLRHRDILDWGTLQ